MKTEAKPHISGWCSNYDGRCTSPKAHKTCQKRLDKGELKRCDCPTTHTTRDPA